MPKVALKVGLMARRAIAAVSLLAAIHQAAAQPRVKLTVNVDEAYVDEPFLVTIQVENFSDCEPPVFPPLENCTVRQQEGVGESTHTVIINGRMTVTRSRTYTYEIVPHQAGQLVLPPVKVIVDGRAVQTERVSVRVKPSQSSELFWVEINCDRKRIYVGQRVRIGLTIWVRPPTVEGYRFGPRDILSMQLLQAINFGPFPTENVQTQALQRTAPDGSASIYYTYTTYTDYVPDRPGRLSFDDIEVGMTYPTRLSRDIFGRIEVTAHRRLRAKPKPLDIEVLPLPAAGRPPNFTGAVGVFDITVSAEPTSVRVGDPITLTIEIRGDGAIDALPPPDLAANPNLAGKFRVPQEELAGQVIGSRKRFTQVIRAETTDVTEIPAIEYPYFDPESERYCVAKSEPIPIRVLPSAQLDASSLSETVGTPLRPPAPDLRPLDVLRANETLESLLLTTVKPVSLPTLAGVVGIPPAGFFLAWAFTAYARRGGEVRRRRQAAFRAAQARLERAGRLPPRDAAAEVAAAMLAYLSERAGQPAARFAGRDGVIFLHARQVPPDVCQRWEQIMSRCEQASYAGVLDGDIDRLIQEARQCLRALSRHRL
jgi:hypothetical protein